MAIKQVILFGSLFISVGATLATSTAPAQAFIVQLNTSVPQDIVGYTVAYTNDAGVTTNGISLSSPSFPFTSFTGDGTNTLTANFFGGAVPANTPFTLNINIADAPPPPVPVTTTATAYVLSNGVISPLPSFQSGTLCSTQGGGTPYEAVSLSTPVGNNFFECQGNTLGRLNLTNRDITESISIKPISGYQDIDTLGTFPPATTVTERPGLNLDLLQTVPQTVPEPSEILGTLAFGAIGAGCLLKRQTRNKVG